MDTKTAIFLIAGLVFAWFFISSFELGEEKTQTFESVSRIERFVLPVEIRERETIPVELKAVDEGGIRTINYKSDQLDKTIDCEGKKECDVQISDVFEGAGAKYVKVTIHNMSGKIFEEKKLIYVLKGSKTCLDGTVFNECSKDKPLKCVDGSLIEKCEDCGCDTGKECKENSCIVIVKKLDIVFEEKSYTKPGKKFGVKVGLKNNNSGEVRSRAAYQLSLGFDGKEFVKEISIENDLMPGETIWNSIEVSELGEGTYSVQAELKDSLGKVLNSEEGKEKIVVKNDNEPPKKPEVFLEEKGSDLVLKWQMNSEDDLSHYKVYKSNSQDVRLVTYRFDRTIPGKETSTSYPDLGKEFFVVTAVDYYGNESEYSKVVSN